MAIYHLSTKPVRRGVGRSAVAAAAYRAGQRLTNERDGVTHDFRRRQGVVHAEIITPDGVTASWMLERSQLWNAAEAAEGRRDARVAREWEMALPHELDAEQRLELTRAFAKEVANRYGVAVDFAIHAPHPEGDVRNHHAHLLATTRVIEANGFGAKALIERDDKRLVAGGHEAVRDQIRGMRLAFEEIANAHLARAGLDMRVDHRSHRQRGLAFEPTTHVGVQATSRLRRGQPIGRSRIEIETEKRNIALLRASPDEALSVVAGEKGVFDENDVARTVQRYLGRSDDSASVVSAIMASPSIVQLTQAEKDEDGKLFAAARFSSKQMIATERGMVETAERLSRDLSHGVARGRLDQLCEAHGSLKDEQRDALSHATGRERIAAVVGLAGTGKTTMLRIAREAWERDGYRVVGAALAGKAAEGLEEESGIRSRTLASWQRRWELGKDRLEKGDVIVIDEAGMVGSQQLAAFITAAEKAGGKIVLVGDPAQLQPIAAGAAFRAVAQRIGFAEMEDVRRQKEFWQSTASKDFARFRTQEALRAYRDHGRIAMLETRADGLSAAVAAYMQDQQMAPEKSRLLLAYARADVADLNAEIREHIKAQGKLLGEASFASFGGLRQFAAGDRVLFRETRKGYKNGWLGTVESAAKDEIRVRLDANGRTITVNAKHYDAVDYGYATTIHKSQGATVDRSFVVASKRMDRHLAYVAMTRHRESVVLYGAQEEFKDFEGLSAALSRSEAKETTLDYVTRRGLAPDSDIVVPEHLVRGGGVFETVTRFRLGETQAAREAVRDYGEVVAQVEAVRTVANRIYRDPQAAAAKLVAFAEEWSGDRDQIAAVVAAKPEQFGSLRGRSGFLAGEMNRTTRREAVAAARELGVETRLYARAFQNHLADAIARERSRREALRIEVPALTERAWQMLQDAEQAAISSDKMDQGKVRRALASREGEEIKRFSRAIAQRFGDVTKLEPKDLKAKVVAGDVDKIDQYRKLMIAARRLDQARQAVIEQEKGRLADLRMEKK